MPLDSGFKLDDICIEKFNDMKIGSKTARYIVMKLNDEKTRIVVETEVMKDPERDQKTDYDDMCKHLAKADGRFVIIDLTVKNPNGSSSDQLYCIMWNPDNSGARSKMLYATALECVKKTLKLEGGAVSIQANDFDDISYEILMKGKK